MTQFITRKCSTCMTEFSMPAHVRYHVNGGIEILMDEVMARKLPEHNCIVIREFMIDAARADFLCKNNLVVEKVPKEQQKKIIDRYVKKVTV